MKKNYISRKERIILSAIELLNESGVQGLTIRELANKQSISEPAIYRHFKSKQEILIAVLDKFTSFDAMIENTAVGSYKKAAESIEFYVRAYVEYYHNYPEIASIALSYDMFSYEEEVNSKMEEINKRKLAFLQKLIQRGQDSQELRKDIGSEELAGMIICLIKSETYKWKVSKYEYDLKEKVMLNLQALLMIFSV